MINFIVEDKIFYSDVIYTMINPIVRHLSNYNISDESQDDCINVHFFSESYYVNKVGLKGIGVFIAHGLGDKNWRSPRENAFDYVVACSPYWKQKLIERGVYGDKIFIGGHPKIDLFYDEEYKTKKDVNKKTILWCPTHNVNLGQLYGVSSNPCFKQYIGDIPGKYKVITHEHPFNDSNHKATILDLINADVIITDFSSMIYEAWILKKPIIFPDWIVGDSIRSLSRCILEQYIYEHNIGYHAKDMNDLINYIEMALNNGIDIYTKNFIENVFPLQYRGTSGKMIADFLLGLEAEL